MGTPSYINGIIDLNSTNPSITGNIDVSGFLVNSSNAYWVAKVTDANDLTVFYATHSNTVAMPFAHSFSPSIQIKNLDFSTSSNIDNILVYTGL